LRPLHGWRVDPRATSSLFQTCAPANLAIGLELQAAGEDSATRTLGPALEKRERMGRLAFAVALSALFSAGCLPTFEGDPSAQTGTGGNGGTSGNSGGSGGDSGSPTADAGPASVTDMGSATAGDLGGTPGGDLAIVCDSLQPTSGLSSPSGQHNAGQECQGCHAPGGGAPTFYVGGTLYSAASGGSAVAGATINITDANGKQVKIVSANNGNFWTRTALAYPIKVDASLCPSTVPMIATVAGNGACNNCHNSAMRVHVP